MSPLRSSASGTNFHRRGFSIYRVAAPSWVREESRALRAEVVLSFSFRRLSLRADFCVVLNRKRPDGTGGAAARRTRTCADCIFLQLTRRDCETVATEAFSSCKLPLEMLGAIVLYGTFKKIRAH